MSSLTTLLCTLVLFAVLRAGSSVDSPGSKMFASERILDKLDVLQEDGKFDPLALSSPSSELFEIAKRVAQKKDGLEGRDGYEGGYGGGYGGVHRNNMDRFEHYTKQFLDLSVDISYSAVYLLQNYTRFVHNANNKYIIIFE